MIKALLTVFMKFPILQLEVQTEIQHVNPSISSFIRSSKIRDTYGMNLKPFLVLLLSNRGKKDSVCCHKVLGASILEVELIATMKLFKQMGSFTLEMKELFCNNFVSIDYSHQL